MALTIQYRIVPGGLAVVVIGVEIAAKGFEVSTAADFASETTVRSRIRKHWNSYWNVLSYTQCRACKK